MVWVSVLREMNIGAGGGETNLTAFLINKKKNITSVYIVYISFYKFSFVKLGTPGYNSTVYTKYKNQLLIYANLKLF